MARTKIFDIDSTGNEIMLGDASSLITCTPLTASRLVATDASKGLVSVTDLTSWIAGTANQITVIDDSDGTVTLSIPSTAEITFSNTGLHILDSNASHDLIIKPGSDLTADKTLTITTGDSDRTITLSGDTTLADWFDQNVKTTSSPSFGTLSLSSIKSGATQVAAGASANELWKTSSHATLPDNVVMIGV